MIEQAEFSNGIKTAEFAVMDLLPKSGKNYDRLIYELTCDAFFPYEFVTEISVVPDVRTKFEMTFKPMRALLSREQKDAVKSRLSEAKKLAIEL